MHWFDQLAETAAQTDRMDRRTTIKLAGAAALAVGPLRSLADPPAADSAGYCYSTCYNNALAKDEAKYNRCAKRRDARRRVKGPASWFDRVEAEYEACLDRAWELTEKKREKCRKPYCGDRKKYPPGSDSPGSLPPPPPPPGSSLCPEGWIECPSTDRDRPNCAPQGYTCCGSGNCPPGHICCASQGQNYCSSLARCPG